MASRDCGVHRDEAPPTNTPHDLGSRDALRPYDANDEEIFLRQYKISPTSTDTKKCFVWTSLICAKGKQSHVVDDDAVLRKLTAADSWLSAKE
ncbi:hypothetical protein H0H92_000137 [Tricholoma furcatifolium]|nr:hypothetical protein H0H92_000137 [Tricholoma furcatifolium]